MARICLLYSDDLPSENGHTISLDYFYITGYNKNKNMCHTTIGCHIVLKCKYRDILWTALKGIGEGGSIITAEYNVENNISDGSTFCGEFQIH